MRLCRGPAPGHGEHFAIPKLTFGVGGALNLQILGPAHFTNRCGAGHHPKGRRNGIVLKLKLTLGAFKLLRLAAKASKMRSCVDGMAWRRA